MAKKVKTFNQLKQEAIEFSLDNGLSSRTIKELLLVTLQWGIIYPESAKKIVKYESDKVIDKWLEELDG